jgi:hypothetical protein
MVVKFRHKKAIRSFESVSYFRKKEVRNQKLIQEEIKRRLNSGCLCFLSVHKLSAFHLLSRNLKLEHNKTTILPVVLYGSEIWFLILREGHRLRVFEGRVLRKILGPKRDEVM